MVTEIRIGELLCPAVKDTGQGGSLTAAGWQVSLQHEYQGYIALGSKVLHIFGNDGAAFRSGGRGDLRVISCPEADLANVDGV